MLAFEWILWYFTRFFVNISLTDKESKYTEYSTRGKQSSNIWWEYRKEKLTASNFYIVAVSKEEPSNKIKPLFYSSVKTSSTKHDIANERVVLTVHVFLLTTQSVTVNLVQPGLILSKSYLFLGHHLTFS